MLMLFKEIEHKTYLKFTVMTHDRKGMILSQALSFISPKVVHTSCVLTLAAATVEIGFIPVNASEPSAQSLTVTAGKHLK